VARTAILPLVADPVVYNTQVQTNNVLLEGLKPNVQVVSYNMQVVLDIRLYDLLTGLIIACKVVCKPWKVLLEVLLLYICTAKGQKYRCHRQGEEAGVSLEATTTVVPVQICAREEGALADDL
jgi:hypothetical protein